MICLTNALSQQFTPETLPAAVRTALGKPLRRAAPLTQLALLGALACMPEARRHWPTALLWQSTSGPQQETLNLLAEVCQGSAEPMPYDFLATQPALAAVQIQPFFPGLESASHCPLDTAGQAHWSLLLDLASHWLSEGRYAQVLCAHLDSRVDIAQGHWLCLSQSAPSVAPPPLSGTHARWQSVASAPAASTTTFADTPEFPVHLAAWLQQPAGPSLFLQYTAPSSRAVEFIRI